MTTSITGQGITAYKAPDDALSNESKNAVQNKVISGEVTDLQNAISELDGDLEELVNPINVYDYTQNVRGAFNVANLTWVFDNNVQASDYIAVEPGDVIRVNQDLNSSIYGHAFYNSSKAIIGGILSAPDTHEFIVPNNVAFIRFSVLKSTQESFVVNVFSDYVGYILDLPQKINSMANPFVRQTIKPNGVSIDGFSHCAFPSVALFGDKEIVAYRASKSHLTPTDPSNWGGVMIDYRNADGTWTHKGLLDTTGYSFNGELRDPKLTVSRDGKTIFLSCFTTWRKDTAPNTDVHDNVIFVLDEDLSVTSMYHETEADYMLCGNVLTTPNGYLLVSEYNSGTVVVKRSAEVFSGTLSDSTFDGSISATFTATDLTECCMGYWNDERLMIVMRRGNNPCHVSYTEDLEGTSGWANNSAINTDIGTPIFHAPMLLPCWYGEYLPVMAARHISASNRHAEIALMSENNNVFTWIDAANIDQAIKLYSGYCGFVYFGGDEFAAAYYQEGSQTASTLGAQTAIYYKHFNLKRMMASSAYLESTVDVTDLEHDLNDLGDTVAVKQNIISFPLSELFYGLDYASGTYGGREYFVKGNTFEIKRYATGTIRDLYVLTGRHFYYHASSYDNLIAQVQESDCIDFNLESGHDLQLTVLSNTNSNANLSLLVGTFEDGTMKHYATTLSGKYSYKVDILSLCPEARTTGKIWFGFYTNDSANVAVKMQLYFNIIAL